MKFRITLTQEWLLCLGVAILTFCTPYHAFAQGFSNFPDHLEVSGGFTHLTGDFGLNGFNAAAGLVNFDYDSAYHTSTFGVLC